MAITSTSEGAPTVVDLETIYSEVRTAIRETDSISFKLLGLVPLVSGTALIGFVWHELRRRREYPPRLPPKKWHVAKARSRKASRR